MPNLYLITDRNQTNGRPLVDVVKSALDGGVRLIQLREKDLSGKELFCLARDLRELTNRYNAKLLINDRVDVALAVDADGVHLGHQSISVQDARRVFEISSLPGTVPILPGVTGFQPVTGKMPVPPNQGQFPIIGVSTHSIKEALQAQADGADFITFGPVYSTPSKAGYGKPVGVERLKEVVDAVNIPVFALGGIKKDKMNEVIDTGTYGVAMISAIMAADDVKKESEDILKAIADPRPLTIGH